MIATSHFSTKDFFTSFSVLDTNRQALILTVMGLMPAGHGITEDMRQRTVVSCADASGEFMIWRLSPVPLCVLNQEAEQLLIKGYVYADSSWMTDVDCRHCKHPGTFHIRYHLHDQSGKFLRDQSRCFDVCFACLRVFESVEVEYPKSKEAIKTCSEEHSQTDDHESPAVTSEARPMTSKPSRSKVSA